MSESSEKQNTQFTSTMESLVVKLYYMLGTQLKYLDE